MKLSEKPIVFGIMIACVLGIIIVGGFIAVTNLTGVFSGGPFSELYFDEHTELPNVIEKGDDIDLSFTVAAHNNDPTHYTYKVSYGVQTIDLGSFDLPDASGSYENKISIHFAPKESTLILLPEPAGISYTTLDTDGTIGMVYRDTATGTILEEEGYPLGLPIGGQSATLLFDTAQSEMFSTKSYELTPVGDIFHATPVSEIKVNGEQASGCGYDLTNSQWEITHSGDQTTGTSASSTLRYRYVFKKVSVEVKAYENADPTNPTRYEIHFWLVVLEDKSIIKMFTKQPLLL